MLHYFSNLPNWLGVDKSKQSDPYSFHFWYRQLFHGLGGASVAAATFFSIYAQIAAYGILSAFIAWREVDDAKHGQPIFKTIVDFLVWTASFILIMYL